MMLLTPTTTTRRLSSFLLLLVAVSIRVAAGTDDAEVVSSSSPYIIRQQRNLLLEFYRSLGGDSWNVNTGWVNNNNNDNGGIGTDYCDWFGVICEGDDESALPEELLPRDDDDTTNQRRRELDDATFFPSTEAPLAPNRPIIGLVLRNNYLSGRTPASLWSWPHLKYLDISFNANLEVAFTENNNNAGSSGSRNNNNNNAASVVIDSLVETLKLHNTATETLTGIANLAPTLTALHLSQTFIDAVIPNEIFALTKLQKLHLNNCALRGTLSEDIGNLSDLQYFNLFLNQLTGTLPTTLRQLTNLKIWSVGSNQFTGSLAHVFPPSSSSSISSTATATAAAPLAFQSLEQIFFMDNRFTGTVPSFYNLPRLSKVQLADNLLFGSIPDDFLQGVVGEGHSTMATTTHITNGMEHAYAPPIHESSSTSSSLAQTYYINLSNNLLSGTIPASLDRLESLNMRLDLRNNKFIDVDESLCDNRNWNQGDVENYGCYGIVCPIGTYSSVGRQTDDDNCYSCYDYDNDYEALFSVVGMTDCIEQDDRAILTSLYLNTQGNRMDGDGDNNTNALFASSSTSSWHNSYGWLHDDTDVCDWHGITCGTDEDQEQMSGRVRIIDLSNNGLNGTIPDSVFSLQFLQTLVLRNNDVVLPFQQLGISNTLRTIDITKTRTTQFKGLQHAGDQFEYLYADRLPIRGTIPSQIMALSNLRSLSLAECEIMDSLDFDAVQQWKRMRDLYLYGNHLHGTIPHSITYLTHLRVLSLAKNSLTGTIPTGFDSLPELAALSLKDQKSKGGGGLIGTVPSFRYSPNLRSLLLGSNSFQGSVPKHLLQTVGQHDIDTDVSRSITIDLSDNELTGVVPLDMTSNFNRLNVYLDRNRIQQFENDAMFSNKHNWMDGLVSDFGCAAILCPSGTFSADESGRQQYTNMPCESCPTNTNGQQVAQQQQLPQPLMYMGQWNCRTSVESQLEERNILQLLYASTNGRYWTNNENWLINNNSPLGASLNDNDYDYCNWYGITCNERNRVTSITLGSNNLNGPIPNEIFFLDHLEKLSLYENPNIEITFDDIEHATMLKSLILDSTGLSSLEGISYARRLEELNVQNNLLEGPITNELYRLVELRSLDISMNRISGEIPFWFHNLPMLKNFMASYNLLGGPVPELSNFKYLAYLDLSHNDFTGTIPSNFLQSLVDHSSDPTEEDDYFAEYNGKVVVDLSYNRITGIVPSQIFRQMNRLSVRLIENEITGIDTSLCHVDSMNEYNVQYYGCNAILCPVGTSSAIGRQASNETRCTPCEDAVYMGSTVCHPDANPMVVTRFSSSSGSSSIGSSSLLLSSLLLVPSLVSLLSILL